MNLNKKKILFVQSNLNFGGAQRFMINLANDLVEDHDVFIITIHKSESLNLSSDLKTTISHFSFETRAYKSIFSLRKKVIEINPDVILSTQSYINVITIIAKLLARKNNHLIIREASALPSKSSLMYWSSKFLYKKVDKIIAQTKLTKDEILSKYNCNEDQVKVIPNYIDHKELYRKANKYKDETDSLVRTFIFCGRLHEVKRVDLLINYFGQLYEQGLEFNFWIVGDGPEKDELVNLSERKGYSFIKFWGFVANPYPIMLRSDCLVMASEREGFPNVIIEAMVLKNMVLTNNFRGGAANEILTDELQKYIYNNDKEFIEMARQIIEMSEGELNVIKKEFSQLSNNYHKEKLLHKYIN